MHHRSAWLLLFCAGCFSPDLGEGQIACGAAGQCPQSYVCRSDGRCYHADATNSDLAAAPGDLAIACTGADGTRLCLDSTHSGVCQSGVGVRDRDCPPASACATGHCAPPSGATACARWSDCTGTKVCVEYAVGNALKGFCTEQLPGATGGLLSTCAAPGYDATCKSGICGGDTTSPPVLACLAPCKNASDCNGQTCRALGMPSTIEGVATTGFKFCTN